MKQIAHNTRTNSILILAFSSILITFFLFYIDEGYYNLDWMKKIGNWIIFVPYALVFFLSQLFLLKVVLKKYNGVGKMLISILAGPIAFALIFTLLIILFK